MKKRFLIAISLIILLSACGSVGSDKNPAVSATSTLVFRYAAESIDLPERVKYIRSMCVSSESVYFLSDNGNTSSLYVLSTSDKAVTLLDDYIAPEQMRAVAICASQGSLWVTEYGYNEIGDSGHRLLLRELSENGCEIQSCDITSIIEEKQGVNIAEMACDGVNIYLFDSVNGIAIVDITNSSISARYIGVGAGAQTVFRLGDGGVGTTQVDMQTYKAYISTINPPNGSFTSVDSYSGTMNSVYGGNSIYNYLFSDGAVLYGSGIEPTELLKWLDLGIEPDRLTSLAITENGVICCATINSAGYAELCKLTLGEHEAIPEKQVLRVALFGPNVPARILQMEFERNNPGYTIQFEEFDYGYNTIDGYDAEKLTAFNLMITSDNAPDVIVMPTSFSLEPYMAKGAFEDLYPYLDHDQGFSGREVLLSEILSVLEFDGHLYQVSPHFMIETAGARRSIVGDMDWWTATDAIALMDTLPKDITLLPNQTAQSLLEFLVGQDIDAFINWENGTCDFDSDYFKSVLELAAMYPNVSNSEPWRDPSFVADQVQVADGNAVVFKTTWYNVLGNKIDKLQVRNEDITYIGYPSENGMGNTFHFFESLMISSKSTQKDAAWAFVRMFLTESFQDSDVLTIFSLFPTNTNSFEKMVQNAMRQDFEFDENGELREIPKDSVFVLMDKVPVYAATQAEIDTVRNLIKNTSKKASVELQVKRIVFEEAAALFAGQKRVSEVAALIQGRVSIYVSEQS